MTRVTQDSYEPTASNYRRPGSVRTDKKPRKKKNGIVAELLWIVPLALIVVLLRVFIFGVYEIPSGSMEPTLQIGDKIIASKLQPKFSGIHRGDVVVFHDPDHWLGERDKPGDDYLIKRVIGVAGDQVSADGQGPIYVNGKPLSENAYIMPGALPSERPFSITVKQGYLFVMGDNRSNSADSRFHQADKNKGQVPVDKVEAIANIRYWPMNHVGFIRRTDAVYQGL